MPRKFFTTSRKLSILTVCAVVGALLIAAGVITVFFLLPAGYPLNPDNNPARFNAGDFRYEEKE